MNVIGEGSTVDGAILLLEYLKTEPENCLESHGDNFDCFVETALDALKLIKKMPRSPFAFIKENGDYEEDLEVLDRLNKSIEALYRISSNTVSMGEIEDRCGQLAYELEEQRNRKFGNLINWDEVYRFFNIVNK
ncbi:MAG: hypothetical protein RSC84_02660 [Peptostreptococcaceae bacterium]